MKNYRIENDFLSVSIDVKRKIESFSLFNKLTGREIKGAEGSELFVVNFKAFPFSKLIKASELIVSDICQQLKGDKKILEINFEAKIIKGEEIKFSLVYELCDNDHFIRKQLFAFYDDGNLAVVDYVNYAPLKLSDSTKTWCLPKQQNSHISGFALSLGQPVFVDSAFYGCEFPATLNTIENSEVLVKYYCGKTLSSLSGEKGKCAFPKAVIGVADSDSEVRLKKALFSYIGTISYPVKLRSQYNSWYDHMLNISAENIAESFIEIEKNMTAVGSKPLDCYVVDDGWNNYEKDFWCFNHKFPDEFYPSSQQARAFGSHFGMWLGPRGGYTNDTIKFAKRIEKGGNGYVNKSSVDIDVGSDKYIRKTKALMLDLEKRFDLTYWKLDGFIQKPCKNKKHDHITGGYGDMYYYSEVWEKWIDVFDCLHKESKEDVFINLTCYAPPSPWFLQWVNSMWMQISDDMGTTPKETKKSSSVSKKDMMLTYRDDRYYDFYNERKFCFPQSNLYNHDPIYANEAKVKMTDEEFRSYLYSMAMRGTCFWELYYSYNLMNEEKWRINNDVLLFLENNIDVIKNSLIFGGKPSLFQVYGFGAFASDEGLVMLRNPSGNEEEYTLHLNHSIGAEKTLSGVQALDILPYSDKGAYGDFSFGDKMTVTLAPYETRIIHFGKKSSDMSVKYVRAVKSNTAEVMFSDRVVISSLYCKENAITSAKLLDDYRTVLLTFEKPFDRYNCLNIFGVKDVLLNESEAVIDFEYSDNGLSSDGVLKGVNDFTITATTGGDADGILYKQGDEICLYVENNKAVFKVGNTVLCSNADMVNAVQISAVRERNGVLKLYIDKKLDNGIYPNEAICKLEGGEVIFFDKDRVKIYIKALPYDEI